MTEKKPIDTRWLTDNWPWWLVIFFLLVYEFWALGTGHRTLSRMVWASAREYPWMIPIALSVVSWLLIHFFVTKGDWAVELTWTAVIVAVIWIAFFTLKASVSDDSTKIGIATFRADGHDRRSGRIQSAGHAQVPQVFAAAHEGG
ncbi:MAG TPA: hypothetical protein VM531_11020 [Sphingomicrobium sp.]|jgi:uncharacterized membrane protein|nr:hypothetical protein [Sphingomicrobium sp.]